MSESDPKTSGSPQAGVSGAPAAGAADQAAPPLHPDDRPDADNKEIFAYVMGGIAGRIADSDMQLKGSIMMFVLRLNPMLIALVNVLAFVWDAITDPIMAAVTDNSRNRWGRRRPFILAGGVLAALFSIVVWANCPRTDKVEKNTPDIPLVLQSDDSLEKFGQMLQGYGFTDIRLQMPLDAAPAGQAAASPAGSPRAILAKAVKKMNGPVRLVDKEAADTLVVGMAAEGFAATGQSLQHTMRLSMSLGETTTAENALTIEPEYLEKRGVLTVVEDMLKGRHAYVGFRCSGDGVDFTINTFRDRALERARVQLVEKSLIEALGRRFGLPYWICFPERSDDGETLRLSLSVASDLAQPGRLEVAASDTAIYGPLLDQMNATILKRERYYVIKAALAAKSLGPEAKALVESALPAQADRDEVARAIEKGELTQAAATLVNKKIVEALPLAEIAGRRESMKTQLRCASDYDLFVQLHSKLILHGLGYKMDVLKPGFDADEGLVVADLEKQYGLSGFAALQRRLWNDLTEPADPAEAAKTPGTWGQPRLLKSATFLKRLASPAFKPEDLGMVGQTIQGFKAFGKNAQDDRVAIYLMIVLVIMATFTTINSVPYYALGIELAPSYNGRTKVVAYRSVMEKIIALKNPWLFPLVLLPLFTDAISGAMWVGIVAACISIPMLTYSVARTRERIQVTRKTKKISFFSSVKQTVRVPEFWRVVFLYFILGKSIGIFNMVGSYLSIYYVFRGSLLRGASYGAMVGSFATFLALLSVPLVSWICNKHQKHVALRLAIILMMIGCALKWWCYNPDHPALMFIVPIFFSIGISSLYTVMSTLMADVTDADELRNGSRREGMFGAVNAMIMKITNPLSAILASLIVLLSGFDVDAGPHQAEGVFFRMRILFSFLPAALLTLALLLLYKYPLTRQRMADIKEEIRRRREARP